MHRQKAADRPLQNAGQNWNRQNSRNRELPNHPKGKRMQVVLKRMVKCRVLTQQQADAIAADAENLTV